MSVSQYKNFTGSAFTFQFGSILMCNQLHGIGAKCNFTFQSGSILIPIPEKVVLTIVDLYIPIWFYSNGQPKALILK